MRILWEGPFFRPLSLDKVNRELVLEGLLAGQEMLVQALDSLPENASQVYQALVPMLTGPQPVDWHVRHMWPPYWSNRAGPLVVSQHWEFGAVPKDWIEPIASQVAKLVVSSEAEREMFTYSGVQAEKIGVIPLGVNPAIYHPYGPIQSLVKQSRVILWVGGMVHRKGLDLLIQAYQRAFHPHDDIALVIKTVGQGSVYQEQEIPRLLQAALKSPKSPPIVVIDRELTESDMAVLYRSADVLVSAYRGEGFNLPVLEAMACGTLVMASDSNPTNEFVPPDIGWRIPGERRFMTVPYSTQEGWLFECDLGALTELLRHVVDVPESEQINRRLNGLEHVKQSYTWRGIWRKWEGLLQGPSTSSLIPRLRVSARKGKIIWRGPIRNASGYASEAREFLKCLPAMGMLPRIIDESSVSPSICTPEEEAYFSALEQISVSVDDLMIHSLPGHGFYRRNHGLDLARSMFETNRVPDEWSSRLARAQGVLVASPFNVETFTESGIDPARIHVVPSPIDTEQFVPPQGPMAGDLFRFVSVFDWSQRKGWDVLIDAWMKAFRKTDPVILILKVTSIIRDDPQQELSRYMASKGYSPSNAPRIKLIVENWPAKLLVSFYQMADAFVLPTRGEGWGRPILEAMACDVPVIVTDWSAPHYYLTPKNSYPIAYRLIPIPSSYPIAHYRGHQWAEPDVDHLIHQLQACFEHRREGLNDIRQTALNFSTKATVGALLSVLRQFGVEPVLAGV